MQFTFGLELMFCLITQTACEICCFRKQIQEINWQRKNEQTAAGGKLKQLEEKYVFTSSCGDVF